ncbi:MAG: metal ABC transporter permease [bacterium]|jgi:zinc transport system permease protein|nr:metal ABC transporter permease [bacterium]
MLEILQYSFMQRALVAGLITAIVAPTIGIFFVVRRYSAMPDTIAHLSFAGLAASLLLGTASIPTALAVSVVSVLGIEKMREKKVLPSDTIVSLFLFGGLAVAVVLIGLARNANVNIASFLFGSIVTVSTKDIWMISALGAVVMLTTAILWRKLFAVSLDEEVAEATGLPVKAINRILVVLGAAVVAVSMNVIGVLLIGALMVVPVLAAMKLKLSFFHTWLTAVIVSLASVVSGLYASYYLNLASGGAIVLVAILLFLLLSFVPTKSVIK